MAVGGGCHGAPGGESWFPPSRILDRPEPVGGVMLAGTGETSHMAIRGRGAIATTRWPSDPGPNRHAVARVAAQCSASGAGEIRRGP